MDKTLSVTDGSVRLGDIVAIARDAGAAIMKIYTGDEADWATKAKSDASPLTAADLTANALICERLGALSPAFPIMSEENKQLDFEARAGWSYYWCVDPLDGTKEFIKRNGEFTVNIASDAGSEEPMKVATYTEADSGLTLVCSRSHMDDRTKVFVAGYKDAATASMGSSLKFMLIAQGKAHVYPRLAPTMEWDTAASQVVVEEAGGTVVREDTGKPVGYNKRDLLNPFFIARGNVQE
ncbi:hypothetical protein I4F81_004674 [Pyropia yezoensis]|uniref:Uncharacterized protein n=1 Tax=Pyropia yezoensis TaxID=2788 RepID=A0ACC3BWY7_PYRYE|nr:hypothetical protein I4F81_004674 [Neopyropia yezoensis]